MPEVRERIVDALRGRKEQLLRTAYLIAVRTDAKVVNYLARRLVESQGKPPSLATDGAWRKAAISRASVREPIVPAE